MNVLTKKCKSRVSDGNFGFGERFSWSSFEKKLFGSPNFRFFLHSETREIKNEVLGDIRKRSAGERENKGD